MKDSASGRQILVRDAEDGDMAAVQAIYAHHVMHGIASFEEDEPAVAEMIRRRDAILQHRLPYRVALLDGEVKGFAYAAPYRNRPAYRHTVEDSVYVAADTLGLGLGRAMLGDLIERCTELGYRQMVAVIGDSGNHSSINLHGGLGFEKIGVMISVGFKLGGWVDSVIMQRPLGEGDGTPPA